MKKKTITRVGYVAMNKGEFDLSNMSFHNAKELRDIRRHWGRAQEILRVKVIFELNDDK